MPVRRLVKLLLLLLVPMLVTSVVFASVQSLSKGYDIRKLAESKAQSSYVGNPTKVSIEIRDKVSVEVYVSKGDAYAASAIAIYGDYDRKQNKFVYISGGIGYKTKSWCSFACFEKYDITSKGSYFDLRKYDEGEWYKFVAKGSAKYKVTHCILWVSCSDKIVIHSLSTLAYIPKSRV